MCQNCTPNSAAADGQQRWGATDRGGPCLPLPGTSPFKRTGPEGGLGALVELPDVTVPAQNRVLQGAERLRAQRGKCAGASGGARAADAASGGGGAHLMGNSTKRSGLSASRGSSATAGGGEAGAVQTGSRLRSFGRGVRTAAASRRPRATADRVQQRPGGPLTGQLVGGALAHRLMLLLLGGGARSGGDRLDGGGESGAAGNEVGSKRGG